MLLWACTTRRICTIVCVRPVNVTYVFNSFNYWWHLLIAACHTSMTQQALLWAMLYVQRYQFMLVCVIVL